VGRNELCPCGSGRKFKKCCYRKKPREVEVKFDLGNHHTPVIGVMFDAETKMPILIGKDGPISHGVVTFNKQYKRTNKHPKVINRLISTKGGSDFKSKIYNYLIAVDTNQWTTEIGKRAITAYLKVVDISPKGQDYNHFSNMIAIEFLNLTYDKEQYGWYKLLRMIQFSKAHQLHNKIGLIVDSHLLLIDQINLGRVSIIPGFYLPKDIELIFASSDIGGDSPANKAISTVDKFSSELFKRSVANGFDTTEFFTRDENDQLCRGWGLVNDRWEPFRIDPFDKILIDNS
jgi:hypothetical protein